MTTTITKTTQQRIGPHGEGHSRGMGCRRVGVGLALVAWLVGSTPPVRAQETAVVVSASAAVFQREVVVCNDEPSARVGATILAQGGNAIDAAVATALALAVTHPAAGNLGGGGFLVAFLPERGQVVAYDFRETAPAASTPTMYLDEQGRLRPRHRVGPRAAGVPGTPRGLELAHRHHGQLPWAQVVAPAIALARDGFPVTKVLADSLNAQLQLRSGTQPLEVDDENPGDAQARMADFPSSTAAFAKPDGTPWRAGDLLKQPDLASTLQRLADRGADDFYRGQTAHLIVEAMARDGGIITLKDLESYQAKSRPPIRFTYRGYEIYGMSPPSSGGLTMGMMFRMLERFDLAADGPESPQTLHRVTEAMKRAYMIRARDLGDPDFNDRDWETLLESKEVERLAASIGPRATPSRDLAGDAWIIAPEGTDTTHLSVIDAQGAAVALTYTLEESYGSKYVVPGAGFLLNNEMGDFNLIPGLTDERGHIGTTPNLIAPGKRMLSSMSPTLVLREGRVRVVTGSPGGRTIPNTTLWVLLRLIDFNASPAEAVAAPRTHHAWFPDLLSLEGREWPKATLDTLVSQGHRLQVGGVQGDAHTIVVDPVTAARHGVPDPRRGIAHAAGR